MGKMIVGALILALVFGGGWFAGLGVWVSNAAGDVVDGISDAVQSDDDSDDARPFRNSSGELSCPPRHTLRYVGFGADMTAECLAWPTATPKPPTAAPCPGGYTEQLSWSTGLPVPGTRRCH